MANMKTTKRLRSPKDGHSMEVRNVQTRFKDGGSTKAKSGKADREKPSRAPAKKGNKQPTGSSHRY